MIKKSGIQKVSTLILMSILVLSCGKDDMYGGAVSSGIFGGSTPAYWPQSSFPINLKVSTSFTGDENTGIQAMAEEWDSSAGVNMLTTSQSTTDPNHTNLSNYLDSEFGIYNSTVNATEMPAMALAVTQIYGYERSSSGISYVEIIHADIIVNDFNWNFSTNNTVNTYDLSTVILHEVGHFLGLYHYTETSSSVMYPTISSLSVNHALEAVDKNNIMDKYTGHRNPAHARVPNRPNDKVLKAILELRADGECVHTVNGKVVTTHHIDIKKN
jgi:hypothetical protein